MGQNIISEDAQSVKILNYCANSILSKMQGSAELGEFVNDLQNNSFKIESRIFFRRIIFASFIIVLKFLHHSGGRLLVFVIKVAHSLLGT